MSLKLHAADEKAVKEYAKKRGLSEADAGHKIISGAFSRWGTLKKYQNKKKAERAARKAKRAAKVKVVRAKKAA